VDTPRVYGFSAAVNGAVLPGATRYYAVWGVARIADGEVCNENCGNMPPWIPFIVPVAAFFCVVVAVVAMTVFGMTTVPIARDKGHTLAR